MRKYLVAALAATGFAVLASPAMANHSWGGYHWARIANPFTVKLGDNVGPDWDTYLSTASTNWSKSTVLDAPVVAGGSPRRNCKPTSGRGEVCANSYGNNGWLGLASIWITGGVHITQGTVKVNDYYFNQPAYNNSNERHHTMCQEIGHIFGLDHQSEDPNRDLNTCMDYAREPQAGNIAPNQHDYDELAIIYQHLDSFSTIQNAVPTLADNPNAQPYRTARSDSARESVITEYFSDNSRRVMRIVWAR